MAIGIATILLFLVLAIWLSLFSSVAVAIFRFGSGILWIIGIIAGIYLIKILKKV